MTLIPIRLTWPSWLALPAPARPQKKQTRIVDPRVSAAARVLAKFRRPKPKATAPLFEEGR